MHSNPKSQMTNESGMPEDSEIKFTMINVIFFQMIDITTRLYQRSKL